MQQRAASKSYLNPYYYTCIHSKVSYACVLQELPTFSLCSVYVVWGIGKLTLGSRPRVCVRVCSGVDGPQAAVQQPLQELPEFLLPFLLYVLCQHPDCPEQVCVCGGGSLCVCA